MLRCLILNSVISCLVLCFSRAAPAISYTFTSLDFPEAAKTDVFGINNNGKVAGAYADAVGELHGFLFDGGSFTTLDFPGATKTWAFGLNDNDQIVGPYKDAGGQYHGFLYESGNFTGIDFPGSSRTEAKGINNDGNVVGYYKDSTGMYHGFLLTGGIYTTIDFPDAFGTWVFGINDAKEMVGEYEEADGIWHGFLLTGNEFTVIDFPGTSNTRAIGINNAGTIAGRYLDENGWHGFLFDGGSFTTIDSPGAVWTRAVGVNDYGIIVGRYWDDNGGRHGFVAAPIRDSNTIYLDGKTYIKFNHNREAGGKAFLSLDVNGYFCNAIHEGAGGIAVEVGDCKRITVPGSMLKSNRSKTRFRAKSSTYFIKIDCMRGLLKISLRNVDLKGCISNPIKTCVTIQGGTYLCAEEEFDEVKDRKGRLKKLIFNGN